MASFKMFPEKGIYTLIVFVSSKLKVNVGKLGERSFLPGYYAYTGSALGKGSTSLPNRLSRHLKTVKNKHWHIDFLLANENVSVEAVVAVSSRQNLECQINQLIRNKMKAKILIPEFGASDCKNKCESHLLYFGNEDVKCKIRVLFETEFGEDSVFLDLDSVCLFKTLTSSSKLVKLNK